MGSNECGGGYGEPRSDKLCGMAGRYHGSDTTTGGIGYEANGAEVMTCGNGSKKYLVGLCLCLVASSGLFSQEVSEMTDAEIINELLINLDERENSLTEREGISQLRDAELAARESDLESRETSLTERESSTLERENLLTEIEASLKSCEDDINRLTMYRSLSIVLGTTTAGGVLFILFTVFGR